MTGVVSSTANDERVLDESQYRLELKRYISGRLFNHLSSVSRRCSNFQFRHVLVGDMNRALVIVKIKSIHISR